MKEEQAREIYYIYEDMNAVYGNCKNEKATRPADREHYTQQGHCMLDVLAAVFQGFPYFIVWESGV